MVDNNKKLITIGIIMFVVILAVGLVIGIALSNVSSQSDSPTITNQTESDSEKKDVEKESTGKTAEKTAAEKAAAEKAAAEKAAAEKAAVEKAAAEKAAAEKAAAEKAAAEKAAAEKAAAEKAAAEKAAAEKAAAEKAAAEKAAAEKAEKERLENLPAVLVNSYFDYDINQDRVDLNFTFEQTQNVKFIDVYLLNFAGDEISAENYNGVSSKKFRIIPNGVNAQLSVYNKSDSIESVKLIVTYNNGRTDTYYTSFGLG